MIRCVICAKFSIPLICKSCQEKLLQANLNKREIDKDFEIFSFYKYSDIEELLKSKYMPFGSFIFNILAKNSFKKFSDSFNFDTKIYAIPIDDIPKREFSHTALLAKHLKSKTIKPIYNSLIAKNRVEYSGKTLDFRLKNRRNFVYNGKSKIDVILIDDVVTTGLTMKEAKLKLSEYGVKVMFGITLANAKE